MFEAIGYWLGVVVCLAVIAFIPIAIFNLVRRRSAGVPLTAGSYLVRLFVMSSVLAVLSEALRMYLGIAGLILRPVTLLMAITAAACAVVAVWRASRIACWRPKVIAVTLLLAGTGLWIALMSRATYLLGGYLMYATHASALREIERDYYAARAELDLATRPPTESRIPSSHFSAVYEVRHGGRHERIVVVIATSFRMFHCLVFSPHGAPSGRPYTVAQPMHLCGHWYVTSEER